MIRARTTVTRAPPNSTGCPRHAPGPADDLDPVLADLDPRRLIVMGTDADLAAVLLRLLRSDRLDIELAYLPAGGRMRHVCGVCGASTGSRPPCPP